MKWLYVLVLFGVAFAYSPEENIGNENPNLFEGDMILTGSQRMAVDNLFKRTLLRGGNWPKGMMIFHIHPDLVRNRKAMWAIKEGMKIWTSKTCVRFKQKSKERDYVFFVPGLGCASRVGRIGGVQRIFLASGCWYKGIVAHEIGHALGLFHEQSRPDRDRFVTIFWQNIKKGKAGNFRKLDPGIVNSYGSPYDYRSIMHYGTKFFSKNGKPTILPKRKGVEIGQRRDISPSDARQINLKYGCKG